MQSDESPEHQVVAAGGLSFTFRTRQRCRVDIDAISIFTSASNGVVDVEGLGKAVQERAKFKCVANDVNGHTRRWVEGSDEATFGLS